MRITSWLFLVALLAVGAALLVTVFNQTQQYHRYMTRCTESGGSLTDCEDSYVPR